MSLAFPLFLVDFADFVVFASFKSDPIDFVVFVDSAYLLDPGYFVAVATAVVAGRLACFACFVAVAIAAFLVALECFAGFAG